ncbi:MAG TPA: hypothetical protein VFK02_26790 [Kofleriaceae bacterium]|nr:hypothetical protein [Kofleriaceae bacterium]
MDTLYLVDHIRNHRCYKHPLFHHWAAVNPTAGGVGALFHHIQRLCACTRPALSFDAGLAQLKHDAQCEILSAIVKSEADHGPQLATMAAHIVNRRSSKTVLTELGDQAAIESQLASYSQLKLGTMPGYDAATSSLPEDRRVWEVFGRRANTDAETTYLNIGALLAIELLANGHIIPGEVHCLVESGLYGVGIEDPEMEYLKEHAGEAGAENWHEREAISAVDGVLTPANERLVFQGANDCLEAIAALWDVLDKGLLV